VAAEDDWVTPSDLAEYTFCPRAHFYRQQTEEPRSRSARAGETFHRRRLGAERWREEHPHLPWVAVVLGLGLTVVALALLLAPLPP